MLSSIAGGSEEEEGKKHNSVWFSSSLLRKLASLAAPPAEESGKSSLDALKGCYLQGQGTQSFPASRDKQREGRQDTEIQTFSSSAQRGQTVIFWPNLPRGQLDNWKTSTDPKSQSTFIIAL